MADTETPTPDAPQQPTTPETPQGETPNEDYRGAGSKDALKSDLARERDKRQELERTVNAMRNGFAQALGLEPEAATPEQMAEQLRNAQAQAATAARQLAIYQTAGTAGANPAALLDSASFLRTVEQIDPSDHAALTTAIKAAVDANPALAAQKGAGAGWTDAAQGRTPQISNADQEALTVLGF